ncbi:dipeptide epimerase [Balneolaceae bacterium ANBcel3]|nr:dipeptide epimerase [Balneolaceae bacterium ANBcel3]
MTEFIIKAEKWNLPLKGIFTISRSSKKIAENVLVSISADGITGYGEAAPNERYGENQHSALLFIRSIKSYAAEKPLDIRLFMDEIKKAGEKEYAAKAALEMAMLDWIGKKTQVPVYQWLNAPGDKGPVSSFTIGIDSAEKVLEKIKNADKYPILKIKLGADEDVEIIRAIRTETNKPLMIDANEGWRDLKQAKRMIEFLRDKNIVLIEQPMPADSDSDMKQLKELTNIPLIADESFTGRESMEHIAECFHGVNIKIMKTGSVLDSISIVKQAKLHNLKVMVGCMIQSALADAASAIVSLWADYADIDGRLLIEKNECFWNGTDDEARITMNSTPGIGPTFIH